MEDLEAVFAELRARMVGRSAISFTAETIFPELLDELSELVDAGLDRYRADNLD